MPNRRRSAGKAREVEGQKLKFFDVIERSITIYVIRPSKPDSDVIECDDFSIASFRYRLVFFFCEITLKIGEAKKHTF